MNKEIRDALLWAGAMLVFAASAAGARRLGYIDQDTASRGISVLLGLWMVWNGNRIPKRLAATNCARQAQRVSAWTLVLSGGIYVALWVFAPIRVALLAGSAVVIGGVAMTFLYCLSLQARAKAR